MSSLKPHRQTRQLYLAQMTAQKDTQSTKLLGAFWHILTRSALFWASNHKTHHHHEVNVAMACTCPAAIPIVAEWDTRALTQRDCQEANVSCVSRGLHTTDCVPLEAPPLQDGHCFDNLVCSCSCRLFLVIINKQWCQCQQTSDRKRLRRLWIFPIICNFYTTCWDFAKCQDPSVPHSIRQKHAKTVQVSGSSKLHLYLIPFSDHIKHGPPSARQAGQNCILYINILYI